ncbi:MAG TPA: hypothetical protein V6C86_04735 [Oculatellaceae cyanobacterium]
MSTDDVAPSNAAVGAVPDRTYLGMFRYACIFAAAVAVLLLIYWFPFLSGSRAFCVSDHSFYFEPFSRFIGESIRNLHFPLWNPYMFCGMSQVAVPSPGVFYPPSWLFSFCSYSQGVALEMLMHQLVAGFGMFMLVSSFGWGAVPAAVASLIVALTGYMFSLTTNCTLAFTVAFLPLLLWFFRSIAISVYKEEKLVIAGLMVGAPVCVYMLIAAGRPEIFAPTLALLVLYSGLEAVHNFKRGVSLSLIFRGLSWQILALFLGLALAAPILLPVAEWMSLSPRAKGLAAENALQWSANWYDLTCMVCPPPYGDLFVLGNKFLKLVTARSSYYPYVASLFVGPICFALAIWGFFDRQWQWRKWLLLAILLFTLLAVGTYTPVVPYLVRTFRGLSIMRYPVKVMIFPIFFLSVAAARGAKVLLSKEITRVPRVLNLVVWSVALVFGGLLFGLAKANLVLPGKDPLPVVAEMPLGSCLAGAAVIGLLCCLGEVLYMRGRLKADTLSLVLLLAIATNLTTVAICNRQFHTVGDFYKRPQLLESWLKDAAGADNVGGKGRFLSLVFDPVEVPANFHFAGDDRTTSNYFAYSRDIMICNTNIDSHRASAFGYEAAETGPYRKIALRAIRASLVDGKPEETAAIFKQDKSVQDLPLLRFCQNTATPLLSSQIDRVGVHLRKLNERYFDLVREDSKANLRLYRVKAATPRCYFAENWKWVNKSDIETCFRGAPLSVPIIEKSSAKEVPRSENVLAPPIPPPPDTAPPLPTSLQGDVFVDHLDRAGRVCSADIPRPFAQQAPDSSVILMVDKPEHVSISVANRRPGWVILCDHFYPGWTVYVDSVQARLYKANMEMRAVYVPAGSHLVQFEFASESLKLGLEIAAGALAIIGYFFFCFVGPSLWRFVKSTAGQ